MKTLYRCIKCSKYTLFHVLKCGACGSPNQHPYPARFSLVKERRYRPLIKKA